jgi:heme/copper-type cytochrome/quinol oxidase subunit 4
MKDFVLGFICTFILTYLALILLMLGLNDV